MNDIQEIWDNVYSDKLAESFSEIVIRTLTKNHKDLLLNNHPIIDLGCGNGTLLHKLGLKYPSTKLIGIDRKPKCKYQEIEYKKNDLTNTNLPNNFAGIVMMVNISDYLGLSFNQYELFKEVDRILMPGGVYIPLDMNANKLTKSFDVLRYKPIYAEFLEKLS